MLTLQNNATNSLRFIQTFQLVNGNKWTMTQKSNNVDYPLFTFRNGNICVGTTANPTHKLDVVGDINITGDFRKNASLYKPAEAFLANTTTALATSRNIGGTAFNGTADINIDYFALNNKPITLIPSTTNLQVGTANNLIVGTVSGTIERLSVGGNIRADGRVGIGKSPHTTYACDVNGTLNATAVLVGGSAISGSKWTTATDATRIYYNAGNVGIGNTNPTGTLCLGNSAIGGSDGFLLIGKNNGTGAARTQRIGYNANFDLTIGDYGGGTGAWVEAISFLIMPL
jgi:hypothetical protein